MISRRHFILGAAVATGGAVAGIQFYRSNQMSPGEQAVTEIVLKMSELPGAVRFGKMYHQQQLEQNHTIVTIKNISDRLFKTQGDLHLNAIGEVLEKQIQKELSGNQVYLVDGWYLTKTEAEICVLASTIKNGS